MDNLVNQSFFKLAKLLSLLIIISLLVSCGFHFRGNTPVRKELRTLYIQSNMPFGQFEQVLRDTLADYKVKVATNKKQAPIILNIIDAHLNRTAGAISSNLQLRQYTLSYVATYQILSPAGAVIIPTQSVSATATFTADTNQMITSSNNVTDQYLPGLQRDTIFRMLSRLFSDDSHTALQHYFQTSTSTKHEN